MLRFLLLASLVACSLGAATRRRPRLDGRIIGGRPVDIADFPYQVSLEHNHLHWCGGSIISPDWVVTAAYCVSGLSASNVQFRAGSSIREYGGTVHPAAQLIADPRFDYYNFDFDVAVARVSVPFKYGIGIQPISLTSTEPAAGSVAVVSGWGHLTSGGSLSSQLQAVNVFITSRTECDYAYAASGGITENMICANVPGGGKGPCIFDDGGPLVVGCKLVGIVSLLTICKIAEYPEVYSNVANLKDFITQQTGVQ